MDYKFFIFISPAPSLVPYRFEACFRADLKENAGKLEPVCQIGKVELESLIRVIEEKKETIQSKISIFKNDEFEVTMDNHGITVQLFPKEYNPWDDYPWVDLYTHSFLDFLKAWNAFLDLYWNEEFELTREEVRIGYLNAARIYSGRNYGSDGTKFFSFPLTHWEGSLWLSMGDWEINVGVEHYLESIRFTREFH